MGKMGEMWRRVKMLVPIRTTLGNIDGNLTVLKVQSLAEQVSLNFNSGRLVSALTGLFGLLAQLFGVNGYDPSVIGGAALILATAALAAGMVPAFRAASIDPMKALRAE